MNLEKEAAEYSCGIHWKGKKCYAYGTSLTSISQGKYIPYLAQLSGLEIVNRGIPGGGITNLGGYSKGQVKHEIMNLYDGKAEADLILFEVGANEGGELGNLFDADDMTFCGCLNQCLRYLLQHTDAQIAVIPSSVAQETKEIYYQRLFKLEEVCKMNRVYFLGHADGLGQYRIAKDHRFVVDHIHQTEIGGYNRALAIWSQLKHVPLLYTELDPSLL